MKKNVLILGFLQLLVCMPMALLSSEEQHAADQLYPKDTFQELLDETRQNWDRTHHETGKGSRRGHAKRDCLASTAISNRCRAGRAEGKKKVECIREEVENDKTLSEKERNAKRREVLKAQLKMAIRHKRKVKGGV